jgi:hypothetical protein
VFQNSSHGKSVDISIVVLLLLFWCFVMMWVMEPLAVAGALDGAECECPVFVFGMEVTEGYCMTVINV